MEHTIRAIIFDIGGTLVNKQKNGQRNLTIINKMVKLLNTDCSAEELVTEINAGESRYKTWKKMTLVELPLDERWSKFLLPHYPEDFIRQNAVKLQNWWVKSKGSKWMNPETIQTLNELRSRGYIMATVSHTSPEYLSKAGISSFFQTTLYAADFGKRKPHPAMFLAAAQDCGVIPQECAYVGDRPSRDIIGSREAGFGKVILVQRPGVITETEPCPMQADGTIQDITELLGVFPGTAFKQKGLQAIPHPPILYDAGLSTMWWSKDSDNADIFFQKGRELGFARFELNHQITPEEFATIDLNSFHMGSLHDPCPAFISTRELDREDRLITSLNEDLRQKGVEVVKRTIELTYNLGARSVVIHPGRIVADHSMDNQLRELYKSGLKGTPDYSNLQTALIADREARSRPHLDALLKSLEEIVFFSRDTGISLGLENRLHYYELPIFNEMEIILSEFQQPWVGWQLDTGHLQIHDALGLMSFSEWLEHFSHRIIGVHLHDVQGIIDHRAPGCGDVDFELIGKHLPPYSQRIVEIDKSVTYEELQTGMKILEAAGCITQI